MVESAKSEAARPAISDLVSHIRDIVKDTVADDGLEALDDARMWQAVEKAIAEDRSDDPIPKST